MITQRVTILICFYLFLFVLLACNKRKVNNSDIEKTIENFKISTDSVTIPRIPNGKSTGAYELLKTWSTQLKLRSVDTSSTDFEFRAWLNMPGLATQQRLFILHNNKKGISAELIRFRLNWWERHHQIFVMASETKNGIPKSGWDNFLHQIFSAEFTIFFNPNMKSATRGGTDGNSVIFEIITNNHYWLTEFDDPFENEDNRKTNQMIKKIAQSIENEFNFYSLPIIDSTK